MTRPRCLNTHLPCSNAARSSCSKIPKGPKPHHGTPAAAAKTRRPGRNAPRRPGRTTCQPAEAATTERKADGGPGHRRRNPPPPGAAPKKTQRAAEDLKYPMSFQLSFGTEINVQVKKTDAPGTPQTDRPLPRGTDVPKSRKDYIRATAPLKKQSCAEQMFPNPERITSAPRRHLKNNPARSRCSKIPKELHPRHGAI